MNLDYYKHIPCGDTIPLNNPYAFSVSMPTIDDVIEYEEETEKSKNIIKYAYPRIVFHPYINRILNIIKDELTLNEKKLFLLPNLTCAERVAFLTKTNPQLLPYGKYVVVAFNENELENINNYYAMMKHCGFMIFDREARDLLVSLGEEIVNFDEDIILDNPEGVIIKVLEEGYNTNNILLSNCGMNSIYVGLNAVNNISKNHNKNLVLQYGWAYSDTIQIIKKCSTNSVVLTDVSDTTELEEFLKLRGTEVSSVFLESVSNPLISVPDIPRIYELSKIYGFYVLIDNTFATPWNVNISEYSDIIFESLTKYASGEGDIMAGAIIIPKTSKLSLKELEVFKIYNLSPYYRTLERLAHSIKDYKERTLQINKNTKNIITYLEGNKHIGKLYKVDSKLNTKNWEKIKKNADCYCGVFSIIPSGDIASIYDKLELPKGPSLGTNFPLIMPYTLLAHYWETKSEEGVRNLNNMGLSPNLIRVSVGLDDPEFTIKQFKKVFSQL